MRCRVPLLCVLLVAALVFGAVPAGAQPPAEETRLEVQLQDDGDARWTIVATIPLSDEEDVENFRSFSETYEQGNQDFRLGVETFRQAADEASSATGREMPIGTARRSAELVNGTGANDTDDKYGELRVSFTWQRFARIGENGTMYVGDAFRTADGTWLPGLGPNQTLVVRSPSGYTDPTAPAGTEIVGGDLRWRGPQTFEPGYFTITYQPDPGETENGSGVSTALLAGALALSAAALLLGLYLLWRRRDGTGPEPEPADAEPEPADAEPEPADAEPEPADTEPDLELLSDEERVEYLLEQNGGRMKQANIVKETGWSNAKVSQLLSAMADDDRVDKLRIGRENLISLPGEGVTDIDADEDNS